MIGQAFSAEWSKALRQPRALFWAYIFTPVAGLGLNLLGFVMSHQASPPGVMDGLLKACAIRQSPFVLLFLVVGAAGLFGGEYRWLTWRYLLVRNSRLNLLLAKLAVFLILASGAIVLCMLGAVVTTAIQAGAGATIFVNDIAPVPLLAAFALAIAYAAMVAALTAAIAVASRNPTGAIIAMIVLLLALEFAAFLAKMQNVVWAQEILPGFAFERLTAAIHMLGAPVGDSAMVLPTNAPAALAVLAGWIIVPFAAAAALFSRQDLSRE
jgi:ABC-2 type transport system permease protein